MRPVHPGELLGEELRELAMSATAFAAALGVPPNRITAILNGQRGITADTALRLARYFGMSAQFWMNLQQAFELRSAEIRSGEAIERSVKPRESEEISSGAVRQGSAREAIDDSSRDGVPSTSKSNVSVPRDELAALCKTSGIRRLAVFGSALRDDFNSESDVDLLVEFEPGQVPGLIGLAGIEIELSSLLGGRKADVRTPEDLSRYFRDQVLDEAETLYARG